MINENFEELIQAYWEKVQQQYSPFVAESGILACRDYYVFQTEYKYQPELMIVGLNPGGNGTGHGGWLAQGKNSYTEGNHPCFQTLRNAFDYPNNKDLAAVLETCVASNKYFG